jgi:hypothetical protein
MGPPENMPILDFGTNETSTPLDETINPLFPVTE